MLPPVDRLKDDVITSNAVVDRVGKARQDGAPCF
jgi:hypothetical protein